MTELRASRIVLREKRLEDAPEDYAWRTDEELSRLDAASPLRLPYSEYRRVLADELRYPFPWTQRFAIDTTEGKHIGNCMLYDIDTAAGQAELGIMIGEREYWDRGYGTEAITCLADHTFQTTSLKRIYLHTLEWNIRAQHSFVKCGFKPVRKVRRSSHDFLLMELLRADWEAQSFSRRAQRDSAAADRAAKGQEGMGPERQG